MYTIEIKGRPIAVMSSDEDGRRLLQRQGVQKRPTSTRIRMASPAVGQVGRTICGARPNEVAEHERSFAKAVP